VKRLLYIAYFLEVGLLLVLVPWSGFWEQNYFADSVPTVRAAIGNNFVRGGISGLGIVNLCVGIVDLAALVSMRRVGSAPRSVMRIDGSRVE
jgi:hypothetical protein